MFGLVKASRLRDAEADLRASKVRSGEWENLARDNQRECQNWEQLKNNWRAIAESRLVAVLLLRDRWGHLDKGVEIAEEGEARHAALRYAADRQVAEHERTIAMMDVEFNELTAKWEAATAQSALNAAQRDCALAYNAAPAKAPPPSLKKDSISLPRHWWRLNASSGSRAVEEIETAIIRPSSTNRLRWRVNDDDGKALCQSSTGYATQEECTSAFARAAFLISLDYRAPEDDRIGRIREVLTREPDTV